MRKAEGFYDETLWDNGSGILTIEGTDCIHQMSLATYMMGEEGELKWEETDRVPQDVKYASSIKLSRRGELEGYGYRIFGSRIYYTAAGCTTIQCWDEDKTLIGVEYDANDMAAWQKCNVPPHFERIFDPFKDPVCYKDCWIGLLDSVGTATATFRRERNIKLEEFVKVKEGDQVRSIKLNDVVQYIKGMPLHEICHQNALLPGHVIEGPEIVREMRPRYDTNVLGIRPHVYQDNGQFYIAMGRNLFYDPVNNLFTVDAFTDHVQVDWQTYLRILNGERPKDSIVSHLATLARCVGGEQRDMLVQEILRRLK